MKKKDLSWLCSLAKNKDGICLSHEYKDIFTVYEFVCSRNHFLEIRATDLAAGTWCKTCNLIDSGRYYDLSSLDNIAAKFDGKCLSVGYTRMRDKYYWQCKENHKFWKRAEDVFAGNWCKICSGKVGAKLSLDDLKKFAQQKGGDCLSTEFYRISDYYDWVCVQGHKWSAVAGAVLKGNQTWCRVCSGNRVLSIKDLVAFAKSKGGLCLSTEYSNVAAKYKWQCSKGHTWEAEANSVINNGRWCHYCVHRVSKPELEILDYLRNNTNLTLIGSKTGLLKNKAFELDIYCPELFKGIEFNGDYWHSSDRSKERDAKKMEQCREAGIDLLVIKESEFKKDKQIVFKKCLDFLKIGN